MRTLFWLIAYGVLAVLELLITWAKEHAEEQVKGVEEEDPDDEDPQDA